MKHVLAIGLTAACSFAAASWDQVLNPDVLDRIASSQASHYWTAQDVYKSGKGSMMLAAFAVGVRDADASNRALRRPYCVPEGVSVGQLADVAWKYLDEHPQDRHLPGAHLVRESFRSAWPCAPQ